jgi:hypothetical protein
MPNLISLAVLSLSLIGGVASADRGRDQRGRPEFDRSEIRDHRQVEPMRDHREVAPVERDWVRDHRDRDDARGDRDDARGDRDDARGGRGDRDDARPQGRSRNPMPPSYRRGVRDHRGRR